MTEASPTYGLVLAALMATVATGCQEVPRTYSTAFAPGQELFSDDFEREQLGPDWFVSGSGISIETGHLVVEGAKNHPAWLKMSLPDDVRIEFDTWTDEDEGDIKFEFAGDGKSFATSMNYVATGYVLIFGGWNNRLNAIARQNEHGGDRVTVGEPNVKPGRRYHFSIIRKGSELVWDVDGTEMLRLDDAQPLVGEGHDHFAFSGWESRVYFDNLVITGLAEVPQEAT